MKYSSRDGVDGIRWERLRRSVLARDCYLDQVAKRYGKRIEAEHVHHIFPREYFPEYMWQPWNLISVSLSTHNRLHDRDSHKLTAEGFDLLLRTARKQNISVDPDLRKAICN
jgi:5-methylcytosine-specific restriction endonuclease McrA